MGDEFLTLTRTRLGLVAQPSNERDRIRFVPSLAGRKPSEAVRRPRWPLAQHDRVAGDLDVEPVAGFDTQLPACFARHDDLVLGADLDA